MRSPFNRHALWQIAADAAIIATSWVLAWMLRFDQGRPVYYDHYLDWQIILVVVGIQLTVFGLAGFYNRWWRYVSTRDMWSALRGVALASLATFVVFTLFELHPARVPTGVWFIDLLLCLAFVAGSRLLARTLIERPLPGQVVARGKEAIIVGAGDAAQLVIKEMLRNPSLGYTPIAIVDDDPRKRNLRLHGVRVVGTTADLPQVIRDRRPDEVLIAMPSASGEVRGRIVRAAQAAGLPVKTLPGLTELVSGDSGLTTQLRPVQVEDVLGREPVEVDLDSIAGYVSAEVVMVTGAGGSIGSELCRQLSRLGPARLVLVDHSEPALFEVDRELARERGFLAGVPIVADVKDGVKMRQVFAKYRPGVVFHAAAYKHVAMMEANPIEAVRNNTLGTRTMADVAVEFGAKRFVLVSTDKAANPRTIMGQSKALCEWIVETWGHRRDVSTRFVAVRFGNVLGSSGSVIPIFRRQIAKGGPVTVTHPEMTRFFMTIPEAVQLVVQAGAIAERGQVYVLDMGEPVRIMDLAENMIRLSGKEPGIEIPIEVIGPAPGEKLHEVLVGDGEVVSPSPHPKIERISRPPVEAAWLDDELAILERLVEEGDTLELVGALSRIVRDPKRVAADVVVGGGEASACPSGLTVSPRAPTAAGRASARDRARTTDTARRLLRQHERVGSGQLRQPPVRDQPLVDRAHRAGERRPHRRAERDRLAIHRAAGRDDEVGERDQALGVDRVLGQDERRQRRLAQRVPLGRRAREHDRLHRGIGAEPLEHVSEERVPVAVVERDLGRRAHDDEHATQFGSERRGRARRAPRGRVRSRRGSTPPSGRGSGAPSPRVAPSRSSRSCGIASGATTRVAAREPSVCWARANS